MNKIPKCNNKKVIPLKINKRPQKECICGCVKMKTKIHSNKTIIRSFGQDITNLVKNIENHKQTKKSSSYNEKDKVRQKIIK